MSFELTDREGRGGEEGREEEGERREGERRYQLEHWYRAVLTHLVIRTL